MHDNLDNSAHDATAHEGHIHSHEHSHGDGISHTHAHLHGGTQPQSAIALLGYMVDHNAQHTSELYDVAHDLEHAGLTETARLIREGAERFNAGNELLAAALKSAKEG